MQLTISILLYAYILLVAIFVVFAIIHILHLVYLTATDPLSYIITMVFLVGFFVIISGSWIMLSDITWSTPLMNGVSSTGNQNLFQQ